MTLENIVDYFRIELLKERAAGMTIEKQAIEIGCTYHTLINFMRRAYELKPDKHDRFAFKLLNYYLKKGGVKLCPKRKPSYFNGSNV